MEQATSIAAHTLQHENFEGFNEEGKSAVVSRPVVVRVERMIWEGKPRDGRWVMEAIEAEWIAGELQTKKAQCPDRKTPGGCVSDADATDTCRYCGRDLSEE